MKVIIAGSRTVLEYKQVLLAINNSGYVVTEVVSGRALGADQFGERYAKNNDIPTKIFPANWNLHGRSAGFKRNVEMGKYADAAVVVWDGISTGSKHMIETMRKLNKPFYVWRIDNAGP